MGSKKLFSWLLVLVVVSASVAGCKAAELGLTATESVLTAMDFVPQDANLLAKIQISKIINDRDLRDAYDNATKEPEQPQTVEEALNELVTETGIDLRDFTQAVIFADITALEQTDYLGVIAEGTFNEEQLIDNLEEQAGEELTTSDYKGYKLYTRGSNKYRLYIDEEEGFGIAFLSDRMLLLGTTKVLKDAIDARRVSRSRLVA